MKIYVASSWRNQHQQQVVALLRQWGHQVYDYTEHGFNWGEVDENWESWSPQDYLTGLRSHIAVSAFQRDLDALWWANACVLVMPCGRSAHLEAGFCIGKSKPTLFYWPDGVTEEVDLMHSLSEIALTEEGLREWANRYAFCPKCDRQCHSEDEVFDHIRRAHYRGGE